MRLNDLQIKATIQIAKARLAREAADLDRLGTLALSGNGAARKVIVGMWEQIQKEHDTEGA